MDSREAFRLGFYQGSLMGIETPRQALEAFPEIGEHVDAFLNGCEDAGRGDRFRLELNR